MKYWVKYNMQFALNMECIRCVRDVRARDGMMSSPVLWSIEGVPDTDVDVRQHGDNDIVYRDESMFFIPSSEWTAEC